MDHHESLTQAEAPPPSKERSQWTRWLTLSVGLILFVWVLRQVSLAELLDVLGRAAPLPLLVAVACGLAATAFRCLRFHQFFPVEQSDARSPWMTLYGVFASMRMLNLALPLRTGELATLGLLKKYRLTPSIAETLPVWVLLRLSDALALLLWLAPATLFVTLPAGWAVPWWVVPAFLGLTGAAAAAVVVARQTGTISARSGWLRERLEAFRGGWIRVKGPRQIARVIGLAVLVFATMIAINTLAQVAFHSPLPWPTCWLLSAVVLGVSMLPIHGPLGLGTLEFTWVALMGLYGVPTTQAVAIALGIRLLTMFIILVDGAVGAVLLSASPPAVASS